MKLNIKDKLIEKKLNKNQFAKLVQIGYPAACAIYDGNTTRISFETLESICRVLECTPNDIVIADDINIERNIEVGRLSSKLTPILIEMLNNKPSSNSPDLLYYVPLDKKEELQDNLNKYISLKSESKKGDT